MCEIRKKERLESTPIQKPTSSGEDNRFIGGLRLREIMTWYGKRNLRNAYF